MPPTDVVVDANVALKWFHAEGEDEVDASRGLVDRYLERRITLSVLDLTRYEVGNALLHGRASLTADRVATVLEALAEVCPAVTPAEADLRRAAMLAEAHGLTLYDATYAAVAERQGGRLATLDATLLRAGLGQRPSAILTELG